MGNPEEVEGVKAAIKQFESEQDKIKVIFLHTPNITTEYQDKMLTDIAAGTTPDTAFIASPLYRTLIRDSLLLDITDPLKADPLLGAKDYFIEPQEEQRCTQDGKWYGIGSCWVAPHIYYNADLFARRGRRTTEQRSRESLDVAAVLGRCYGIDDRYDRQTPE